MSFVTNTFENVICKLMAILFRAPPVEVFPLIMQLPLIPSTSPSGRMSPALCTDEATARRVRPLTMRFLDIIRAGSGFVPSQWEMVLHCNNVSHWLDASLESALMISGGLLWKYLQSYDGYCACCTLPFRVFIYKKIVWLLNLIQLFSLWPIVLGS